VQRGGVGPTCRGERDSEGTDMQHGEEWGWLTVSSGNKCC
jgi:hypothetical protein